MKLGYVIRKWRGAEGIGIREAAKQIVNLPPTRKMLDWGFNGPKPPKLEECMKHFFGEEFPGAHDAMVDTRACARVYWRLQQKEV